MFVKRILTVSLLGLSISGIAVAQDASQKAQDQKANQKDAHVAQEVTARARHASAQGQSNEKVNSPKRIEDSFPLESNSDRQKSTQLLQQLVVDLLATFNNYKEMHWNLNGPLYLPLHEYYQQQADMYRKQADVFAERVLSLGYSVDGRYQTIARTTKITEPPAGYVTDNESIKLQVDRVTILQKEIYQDIRATADSDPPTSNKLQDLAYMVDHDLWQLRIHLKKPGSLGENLPWASQQAHDSAGASTEATAHK